jgi:hypothetical protein
MAATYEPIATVTLGSSAATIDFTSIPSTYTDLRMIISAVSNSSDNIFYRFNSSSSTVYSRTDIVGTGSTVISNQASGAIYGRLTNYAYPGSTAGEQVTIWDIMNYTNSTTFTTSMARSNRASTGVDAVVNVFLNSSAITSISICTNQFAGTSTMLSGTTATLYGIKAA